MEHLEEIFTVFNDNLINHIPPNIDSKDPAKFFTYYYEHFSLSTYEVFAENAIIKDEDRYTLPLYMYLRGKIAEYEKLEGKIEDMNRKWLIMHLFVLSRCSQSFEMSFMHKVAEDAISKAKDIDEKFLMYYINQLNMALMSESGIALVPRPTEIGKSNINKVKGFTPFFNEVLQSIETAKEILKKRVKVKEINDLSDYIDLDFLKYIKKHEVLAEYFSGIVILKRNVIIRDPSDDEVAIQMKEETLRDELSKFIDSTCDIDDKRKNLLREDLTGLVDLLLL